jgi:hypothetical protein
MLVLVAGLLSGCGQVAVFGHTIGDKQPTEVAAESAAKPAATASPAQTASTQVPKIPMLKLVTVVVAPQAAAKVAADPKFNADALLAAVKSELQTRKLLNDADAHASVAQISVDDYALRPTSNAIVFGNIISAGILNATMQLRDEHGNEVQNLRIEAAAQVSIPANGTSTNPLVRLYREFAITTANTLDGTPPKPIIGADQHPR